MRATVDQIEAFEAGARLLNFRAAARAVGLSPAAFGQRIKLLEQTLGEPLFARTTRRVELTTAGLALLPQARSVLEAADGCLRAIAPDRALPATLTIGTRFELGVSWLTPALPELERTHPSLRLHLYFGAMPDLLGRLRSRLVDCVVSSVRLTDASLDAEPLHDEHYVFVGHRDLLRTRAFTRIEHAKNHCLLDIDESTPLFRYLADAGGGLSVFPFAERRWLGAGAAIKALVMHQRGVAVLPRYMVRRELRAKVLRRILPRHPIGTDAFRLVFRRDDPRRALYDALAGSLRAIPIC